MRKLRLLLGVMGFIVVLAGCSSPKAATNTAVDENKNVKTANEEKKEDKKEEMKEESKVEQENIKDTKIADDVKLSDSKEMNDVNQEKAETDSANSIADAIPDEYLVMNTEHGGKIEKISYKTYDYTGDKAELTKSAYVYLPYDYDETKQYNILFLLHGIGGNEREWGMVDNHSMVKKMMDNLVEREEITSFIVVTPNGRSCADFANTSADFNSFYAFGQELRNDLIPYMDEHYATFAEYSEGYDLTASRQHRAVAGLSMGGMQTINIGMCECLDLFSYFGAFSQAPTTYTAKVIAKNLDNNPEYAINFFYSICGKQDMIAGSSAKASVNSLPDLTEKLEDGKNFIWQEIDGKHDFNIWYLGFYNFVKLIF